MNIKTSLRFPVNRLYLEELKKLYLARHEEQHDDLQEELIEALLVRHIVRH